MIPFGLTRLQVITPNGLQMTQASATNRMHGVHRNCYWPMQLGKQHLNLNLKNVNYQILSSDLNETAQYAVLSEHQSELEMSSCTKTFIMERLDGCQKLLQSSRRQRGHGTKFTINWPSSGETIIERPCRGLYESCKHSEFVINNVQSKEKIVDKPSSSSTANSPPAAAPAYEGFRTARQQLMLQDLQVKVLLIQHIFCTEFTMSFPFQKNKQTPAVATSSGDIMNYKKKSLGGRGRGVNAKFVPPIPSNDK